jgi:hypothetical protein
MDLFFVDRDGKELNCPKCHVSHPYTRVLDGQYVEEVRTNLDGNNVFPVEDCLALWSILKKDQFQEIAREVSGQLVWKRILTAIGVLHGKHMIAQKHEAAFAVDQARSVFRRFKLLHNNATSGVSRPTPITLGQTHTIQSSELDFHMLCNKLTELDYEQASQNRTAKISQDLLQEVVNEVREAVEELINSRSTNQEIITKMVDEKKSMLDFSNCFNNPALVPQGLGKPKKPGHTKRPGGDTGLSLGLTRAVPIKSLRFQKILVGEVISGLPQRGIQCFSCVGGSLDQKLRERIERFQFTFSSAPTTDRVTTAISMVLEEGRGSAPRRRLYKEDFHDLSCLRNNTYEVPIRYNFEGKTPEINFVFDSDNLFMFLQEFPLSFQNFKLNVGGLSLESLMGQAICNSNN